MKHNVKITIILILMFLVTQIIGLFVVNSYFPVQKVVFNSTTGQYANITITPQLPYGTQPPEITPGISLPTIIISMIVAIFLIFLLMKIRANIFIRVWFFLVVILALGITFNSLFMHFTSYSSLIALVIAIPLAYWKIFKRNILVHNLTELIIYPGLAAVFVSILNLWAIIIFLVLISAYDIWAVWHSGFMQKMAKYQINELKLFGGFMVPYAGKKIKEKIQFLREKYKNKEIPEKAAKKHGIKVSVAILGGGDVVFPIIAAGVVLKTFGLIPALIVTLCSALALLALFIFARKGKFYPAMPFLTAGIFIGMIIGWLI